MTRHFGPVCPDGKVMCPICFERHVASEGAVIDGELTDVCKGCEALA